LIPTSLVGVILFAASIGPGYVYVRLSELREPRQKRSALLEAAELVFVGAIASSVAVLLSIAIATTTDLADVKALSAHTRNYVLEHPLRVLGLIAIGLAISYGGTALVAVLAHRGSPPTIKPGYSAWDLMLVDKPNEYRQYATAELRDGRVLSGFVGGFTLEPDEPAKRELILVAPVRIKGPGATGSMFLRDDAVVLQSADILAISTQTHGSFVRKTPGTWKQRATKLKFW